MEEIWKDIVIKQNGVIYDFTSIYKVSETGKIKSFYKNKEKILKPRKHKTGYLYVTLCKNKVHKSFNIHRIVGYMFVPNPQNKPCINHLDENKENNNFRNLMWVTNEENTNYGSRNEKASDKLSKKIVCIETGKEYKNACEAGKDVGINGEAIRKCCMKKPHFKTAKGYHWEYANHI